MDDNSVFKVPSNSILPTVPWTPLDIIWGLVMSIVCILAFIVTGSIGQRLGWPIDPSMVIVFGTSILLIPAWYFTIYKYNVSWVALGLRRFHPIAVGLGIGLMLLSLVFNWGYASFLANFGLQIQPDIAPVFQNTQFPFVLFIGGTIVAPIVEEIFFRGFVFPGLKRRWDWKIAAAISAALFALAHVTPTSFLPIFILGFIFAFLYQVSGSIWPAICMHMLTNTIALSAAYAISEGNITLP